MNDALKRYYGKNIIEMTASLSNAILEAGGNPTQFLNNLETMTVQELIVQLSTNKIRFVYEGKGVIADEELTSVYRKQETAQHYDPPNITGFENHAKYDGLNNDIFSSQDDEFLKGLRDIQEKESKYPSDEVLNKPTKSSYEKLNEFYRDVSKLPSITVNPSSTLKKLFETCGQPLQPLPVGARPDYSKVQSDLPRKIDSREDCAGPF